MAKKIKKAVAAYTQDENTRFIKKRVFIYIRVSTTEQAEEGYSLGEQEERLKKYCEAMGWEVVKVYSDPGYSGGNMERPALTQMLKAIENGEADIVLVDKLDRLSRSQFDTLYMIQKIFNLYNVAFVSRAEAFDTSTPFGRAMVGILAVFAELERERIKERMAEGKEGRIKEGKWRGGNTVPYGYDYNPDTDILEPNEYEAMIVNEIFEMIAQRMPMRAVASELNAKGYKSKTNSKWIDTTIRGMAVNQVYIGKQLYKGEWKDALHTPIVSQELFDKVQVIMEERKINNAKYRPGKRYNSPLGGLIWCHNCHAKFQWKKWSKNKSVYICLSRAKTDQKLVKDINCKNRVYEDKLIEEAVYNEIRKLKSDETYIDSVRSSVDVTDKINLIQKQIETLNKQISKYMDLYSLDEIDMETVKKKIKPLTQERNLLSSEIELLEEESKPREKEDILSFVDLFEAAVASGDNAAIHDSIMELIDYIEIDEDEVLIHWNF